MSEPKFEHDCHRCKFLGSMVDNNTHYDLWLCPALPHQDKEKFNSLIARYSSEGPDYTSVSGWLSDATWVKNTPYFAKALEIAHEKGLIPNLLKD